LNVGREGLFNEFKLMICKYKEPATEIF
jgi:hypothetical protein